MSENLWQAANVFAVRRLIKPTWLNDRDQFPRKIRDEFRLGRGDAGWYQIRKALEANAENEPADFAPFKSAYVALSEKLRPMVYELGFLPE